MITQDVRFIWQNGTHFFTIMFLFCHHIHYVGAFEQKLIDLLLGALFPPRMYWKSISNVEFTQSSKNDTKVWISKEKIPTFFHTFFLLSA